MADVVTRAAEAATRIAELQKERAERLASADAHEQEARKDRLRAGECKKEIAEWTAALLAHQTQSAVASAQQAAEKARVEAESHAADLAKLKEEAAAELEKLKAANAKSDADPDSVR